MPITSSAMPQSSELLLECAPVRILLLTILFVSPAAAQSWTIETTGWDSNLRAVSATHARDPERHPAPVIWASGSNGRTLRSNDGGQHYTRGLINAVRAHSLDLRGIQAFNEKLAYVMSSGPGNMSRIYKTHNGGETWKLEFSGIGSQFFLDALACISETECFALSDPVDGKFVLISTTDGEHWKELPRDAMPAALPNEGAFAASNSCLLIYEKREIYFVTGGPAARMFHSTDLGRTWTVTETPIAKGNPSWGAFSIARLGNLLVVVGGDYKDDEAARRTAAYSLDQGTTWNLATRSPGGFRSAVAFLNRDTLLTVGTGGEDISTDQGAHWTRTDDVNLNAIAVLDGAAWAVGPNATIVHLPEKVGANGVGTVKDAGRVALIGGWGGVGEGENHAGEQERVEEVVDSLDFHLRAGIGQGGEQDRPVDKNYQQHNPGAEIGSGKTRLFVQQHGRSGEYKNCAGEVVDEPGGGNPIGHYFLERKSGNALRMHEKFDAIKYRGGANDHAAQD
jgi:photosystem II stability/assembly factor-like uncharacterized protein